MGYDVNRIKDINQMDISRYALIMDTSIYSRFLKISQTNKNTRELLQGLYEKCIGFLTLYLQSL